MTYPDTIKYLDSFVNYEKKSQFPYKQSFKLARIKGFLNILGNPQDSLKCIHVAGTKGKGSVCAFVAYILKEAGFKVGLYTSPHLSDCRERIRILTQHPTPNTQHQNFEGMISKKELVDLMAEVKPTIDKFCKASKYGPLSFFEVYTILAFVYFKEKKVDFAVLETGLGGRLDATNIVHPLVCGITSISYDHTNTLGNTLTEIAEEKAGIIKNHKSQITNHKLVVVSAPQEKEVIEVISNRCWQQGAVLYTIGKDISLEEINSAIDSQEFNLHGELGDLHNLKIRLTGKHQLINAAVAVSLVSALRALHTIKVGEKAIKNGLYVASWPGRLEIVSEKPEIVLDGAHNVASAKALRSTVKEFFSNRNIILVLGISQDKDIKGICNELIPISKNVILTCANNVRAAKPERILSETSSLIPSDHISLSRNVEEALELVKQKAKEKDLILVCGSLFVMAEARELLRKD